jgi:ATP-dependent DNA helicase RecG
VALMAMLAAVEAGGQAVLMAPTEILARQHLATLSRWPPAGLTIDILTGRDEGPRTRRSVWSASSGEAQIVSARMRCSRTRRLQRPALAVVDEQHRFGVHQRLRLTAKGIRPTCW